MANNRRNETMIKKTYNVANLFAGVDLGPKPIEDIFKQNPNHLPPLFTGKRDGRHYVDGLPWQGPTNLLGKRPYIMTTAGSSMQPVYLYIGHEKISISSPIKGKANV